jgi:DNA repair exonuclease SbcCD ATPase subunit
MTDDEPSPIGTLFQLQRETIKQTEDVIENVMTLPREMSDTVYSGVDTHQDVQKQALRLSRQSVHTSLDAAESVSGGSSTLEDLRDSVDETFDTLEEQSDEAYDTIDEEYDSVGESYDEFSEDALENLSTQLDFLIDLNEDLEGQLVDAVEEFTEQLEELQDQLDEQADDAQERVSEQADDLADRFEDQLDQLSEQFEEQADRFNELEDRLEDVSVGGDEDEE